ncbi:protein kinase, putative [Metarhizium acridum CQMa 102]|uniref:non-specific serine/threonine protein kinase n=1 Tax=Metarhizium acridum (strain CQMa 102) TaxID=655827 RepID=E9DX28_METAQ|nr:protein kinase, putative [Metarhizium acridum CQMa 102]EFY91891.1 protein kinase, putative [Metarhizium acridum CQMa 102]
MCQPTSPPLFPSSLTRQNRIPLTSIPANASSTGGHYPIHLGDELHNRRFRVIHKLGYGGSSIVWLCRDQSQNSPTYVAVKIFVARLQEAECRELLVFKDQNLHYQSRYFCLPKEQFTRESPNGTHLCLVFPVLGPTVDQAAWIFNEEQDVDSVALRKFILPQAIIINFGQAVETAVETPPFSIPTNYAAPEMTVLDEEDYEDEISSVIGERPNPLEGQPVNGNVDTAAARQICKRAFGDDTTAEQEQWAEMLAGLLSVHCYKEGLERMLLVLLAIYERMWTFSFERAHLQPDDSLMMDKGMNLVVSWTLSSVAFKLFKANFRSAFQGAIETQ